MQNETLMRFFPLNALSDNALTALGDAVQIQEYLDEDYVFRLGEEISDLYYVLEGTVQIMDIESRTKQELAHDSDNARHPFSLSVPSGAVAIARPRTRILKVDYEHLCKLMPNEAEFRSKVKPGRKADTATTEPEKVDAAPEYLEMPAEVEETLHKVKAELDAKPAPQATSVAKSRAKAQERKPEKKSGKKPEKKVAVPEVTNEVVEIDQSTPKHEETRIRSEKAVVKAKPEKAEVQKPESRAARDVPSVREAAAAKEQEKRKGLTGKRKSVATMVDELKEFLSSDIVLEQNQQIGTHDEPASSGFLASAKEVLFSDIKLVSQKPRVAEILPAMSDPAPSRSARTDTQQVSEPAQESAAGQPAAQEALSESEYREIELQEYLRAMALYKEKKWESAFTAFKALYAANPRTNLYRDYVSRCEEQLSKWY